MGEKNISITALVMAAQAVLDDFEGKWGLLQEDKTGCGS